MDQLFLPDYYKVSETADLLKIHPESVRRLHRQGKLKATRIGNTLLFPREGVEAFARTYDPRPGNKRKPQ